MTACPTTIEGNYSRVKKLSSGVTGLSADERKMRGHTPHIKTGNLLYIRYIENNIDLAMLETDALHQLKWLLGAVEFVWSVVF
jgi:hypothetical protein